jgi:hypothetical protein
MVEEVLELGNQIQDQKRPFLVTLLAVLVLSITIVNLLRLVNTIALWRFLSDFPGISPFYLAATGLVWALIGVALVWVLWTGNPRAPKAARILTIFYLSYKWLEWIVSTTSGNKLQNWPFLVVLTIVVILFTFWTLSRSDAKAFFGVMHEQSS